MKARFFYISALGGVFLSLGFVLVFAPVEEDGYVISSYASPLKGRVSVLDFKSVPAVVNSSLNFNGREEMERKIFETPQYKQYRAFQDFRSNIQSIFDNDKSLTADAVSEYSKIVEKYAEERRLMGGESLMLQSQLIALSSATEAEKRNMLDRLIIKARELGGEKKLEPDERFRKYKEAEEEIIKRILSDRGLSDVEKSRQIDKEVMRVREDIYSQNL